MWPRSKIFRSLSILFVVFLLTQIIAYFLIPGEELRERFLIERLGDPSKKEKFTIPKCVTDNELAYSAVNRSKWDTCKRQLAFLACNYQRKERKALTISCPHQKRLINGSIYLGCYRDQADERDLDMCSFKLPDTNTPDLCIEICRNHGASLAGVQFGDECHCGDNPKRPYPRLAETHCNQPCPGDKRLMCGGSSSQRIFQTGVTGPIRRYTGLVEPDRYEDDVRLRIAYLLVLNGRGWRQIKRLFKLIYHVNHYYLIHVDKRRDYLHEKAKSLARQYPNVRLTTWRLSTIWGGTSLLKMVLQAFGDLLDMTDWHWDYIINLSESDLPVKSDSYLTAFLTHNEGRNFLKSHGQNSKNFMIKQGMDRLFFECEEHLWLIGRRQMPKGIMLDGGSDWVALHREFVRYAVRSNDTLVAGLKDYFQYSLLPVESFFHTLAQNSKFCNTVVDNNLHFTNWDRSKGCQCQQRAVVDWCGCSPSVIRNTDLEKLERTAPRPIFFARKFDPVVDQEVINNLEEYLYGKVAADDISLQSYWESLYDPSSDTGPLADLHRSFLAGLAGIAAIELDPLSGRCSGARIDWHHPGEGHVYFLRSRFEGVLVRVLMSGADDETAVWAELFMTRAEPSIWRKVKPKTRSASLVARRLISLKIGSAFDLKENFFRNYANVLGPNETISVLHEWAGGDEIRVHFLWIDPSSRPAVLLRVTIPGGDAHKSTFKLEVDYLPLRAGRWCVKVLDETGVYLAEISFLVQPMIFHGGSLIANASTAQRLNCGPSGGRYSNTAVDPAVAPRDPHRERLSDGECALAGQPLARHSARLLAGEWSVREWCVVARASDPRALARFGARVCRTFDRCEDTVWSSVSPDPKSVLGPVNGHSGRLGGE